MSEKFTVVMAVYKDDCKDYLSDSLSSLFHQTTPPNEILIVVDGPIPQDLCQYICTVQNNPLIRVLRSENNIGPGPARHMAIINARYPIIAIMDADDISHPDRFEIELSYLQSGYDVVGAWITEFTDDTNHRHIRKTPLEHDQIEKYAHIKNPMNNVTVMMKKSSYLAVGGFNNIRGFEDYDLYVRMLKYGYKFVNIPISLCNVRTGADMYKRRGGLKLISIEVSVLYRFYKYEFYSFFDFIRGLIVRITVRMLPNFVRKKFYQFFLRSPETQ